MLKNFKAKFLGSKLIFFLIGLLIFLLIIFFGCQVFLPRSFNFISPLGQTEEKFLPKEKPLEKYTFENLKKRRPKAGTIILEKVLQDAKDYQAYLFSYKSEGRKITGLAHIPKTAAKMPVIIQCRGYVDKDEYQTGVGTKPSALVYAANGFITLAPDFLGYGGSDNPPAGSIWEERFLRPVAVVDLIASVNSLPQADPEKIFLWGHSNGGMIALSVLEITGANYPTVLWAPVSRFFPYDVLFYTNEAEDKGKSLRKALAEFEADYDVNKYSIDEYYHWIKAPLQIHQGGADSLVPLIWTNELAQKLKSEGLEVNYFVYPQADHNLKPDWDAVVQRDILFFQKFL